MSDKASLLAAFERCWPHFEAALETHPNTYRKEDVWAQVETGVSLLWPLKKSAVLTTVRAYPNGYKEMWGWLCGGDLTELREFEPFLLQMSKDMGCSAFILSGREGWGRALDGYKKAAVLFRKELI